MNYKKIYKSIYDKRIKEPSKIGEKHHFIPKCIQHIPEFVKIIEDILDNGKIESENDNKFYFKVSLKEHFILHKILVKILPNSTGLVLSMNMLCNRYKNSRKYEWERNLLSESKKGKAVFRDENGNPITLLIEEGKKRNLKGIAKGVKQKITKCKFCGKEQGSKNHENTCEKNPNRNIKIFSKVCCLKCRKEISSSQINRHKCKIKKEHFCIICKEKIKPNSKRHFKIHHPDILGIKRNKKEKKEKKIPKSTFCIKCKMIIYSESKIDSHYRIHHSEIKKICEYCNKDLSSEKYPNYHISNCPKNPINTVCCLGCKKEFSKRSIHRHFNSCNLDNTDKYIIINNKKWYYSQYKSSIEMKSKIFLSEKENHFWTPCGEYLYYTRFKKHFEKCIKCQKEIDVLYPEIKENNFYSKK